MAPLLFSWQFAIAIDFVLGFLWLAFPIAVEAAADFGCLKEAVVTRTAEILFGGGLFLILRQRSRHQCYLLLLGIFCSAFFNAVAAAAEPQWLYVKEIVVIRAIEILVMCSMLAGGLFLLIRQRYSRHHHCYLLDFACYKPPAERQVNTELSIYFSLSHEPINADNINFQWRIYQRSGLGEETCLPRRYFNDGMVATLKDERLEMEESFVAVLDELFAKTCVEPRQIDILVVNVSTFGSAPSLSAWIVQRYKMKESVKTFNLSGMGCSASLIAMDMAKDLFKVYRDSYAVVVGTESITGNAHYQGNDKSMMVTNCLFRVGGYAVLLSNKDKDAARAKMRLLHAVRTNVAAVDEAYGCVTVKEDNEGLFGVGLSPSLIDVAADAMKRNMVTLGSKVLPITEQLYYAFNMICIKALKMNLKPYIPNFRVAFQHFCVHPGGRSVINGIGKSLQLSDYDLEPSRMALHRFGNTSVSGIWYEAAYMEAKRRFKVGDRIWQIGLGSGFKCNSAVWEVLRETHPLEETVWDDCIHRYPCDTRNNYPDCYCHSWL